MPRKTYLEDLAAAQRGTGVRNISFVNAGADDGEFTFVYTTRACSDRIIISVALSDVSEYPNNHEYYVFASEDAPVFIAEALQHLPSISGKPIQQCLSVVSKYLSEKTATGDRDAPFEIDSDGDTKFLDSQDTGANDSEDDVANEDWDLDDFGGIQAIAGNVNHKASKPTPDFDHARIHSDLIAAKLAGFKVGRIGHMHEGCSCYVSISCRIAKLGISEEAMQAWDLEPSQYLILLLYYPSGYKTLNNLNSARPASQLVDMRVGLGKFYKPRSIDEAQRAYKKRSEATYSSREDEEGSQGMPIESFHDSFISRPLNALLGERFIAILCYRLSMGMSWEGAEKYYNDSQGKQHSSFKYLADDYLKTEPIPSSLPAIVTADEIGSQKTREELSFPLLAMQFVLRHFVRCTEFCLVCHCKLKNDLEAIKPYVCNKPLCLYQYMSLGFGPGIEHEIMAQPCVVDLLISFCYTRAKFGRLNDFPIGLGFNVPCSKASNMISDAGKGSYGIWGPNSRHTPLEDTSLPGHLMSVAYSASIERSRRSITLLGSIPQYCPFRKGAWIYIELVVPNQPHLHARIEDIDVFPTLIISSPILNDLSSESTNANLSALEGEKITFWVYDRNFDELPPPGMRFAICMLLDLLPTIDEIRMWLAQRPGARLSEWVVRIPPAALGVLRWIVASNRSCVMQVDQPQIPIGKKRLLRAEDRVHGLPGWMQFRFATGAPDKEQRFIDAVRAVAARPGVKFPTRFAWHGSSLHNWHSIIREGLHFKDVSHGRAFGNGIYLSPHFSTSSGYSTFGLGGAGFSWPQSFLKVSQAVALSEVVNAPQEYVSQSPHFVVSQLDWVQTRYLFVKVTTDISLPDNTSFKPSECLAQHSDRPPTGPAGPIQLPLSAVPRSRRLTVKGQVDYARSSALTRPKSVAKTSQCKQTLDQAKSKQSRKRKAPIIEIEEEEEEDDDDDDDASVATLPEDLEILFKASAPRFTSPSISTKAAPLSKMTASPQVVSFSLESPANLPLLPPPTYATMMATKRLQKDFRSLKELQDSHVEADTLFELGWYLDTSHLERTNNLYQWIISMHSFPLNLPLASDMAACGITSIVFEIRFHANYPISPPFLRVVRPRFLPFSQGGGGHVTLGGSICMDLLTSSGWSPVYDIASVLLQVRMAIMNLDPRPARLAQRDRGAATNSDYRADEAVSAFERVAQAHGWAVPAELREMARMGE